MRDERDARVASVDDVESSDVCFMFLILICVYRDERNVEIWQDEETSYRFEAQQPRQSLWIGRRILGLCCPL